MKSTNVDTAAYRRAARALRGLPVRADGVFAGPTLDEIAKVVQASIRARARRHRRTGRMARQVSVKATGTGIRRVIRIHAGGRVAHLITGGTAAHDISPLHGTALSLAGTGEGFAGVVHHPGTAADPFVAKGVADARPAIRAIVRDAGRRLAAQLAADMKR